MVWVFIFFASIVPFPLKNSTFLFDRVVICFEDQRGIYSSCTVVVASFVVKYPSTSTTLSDLKYCVYHELVRNNKPIPTMITTPRFTELIAYATSHGPAITTNDSHRNGNCINFTKSAIRQKNELPFVAKNTLAPMTTRKKSASVFFSFIFPNATHNHATRNGILEVIMALLIEKYAPGLEITVVSNVTYIRSKNAGSQKNDDMPTPNIMDGIRSQYFLRSI